MDKFLTYEDRQQDRIKGDGNCLFRTLSKQFFGTDSFHCQLRMFLADIVFLNSDRYRQFYIPSGTRTFEQHQGAIRKLAVWGTQVEIQAASDSYQIPIYVCSLHPRAGQIRWLCFKPSYSPVTSELPQVSLLHTNFNSHVELAHTGCHYDSIYSTSQQKLECPELPDEDAQYEVCMVSDITSDSDSNRVTQ